MASSSLWQRCQRYFLEYRGLGFCLDISRMKIPDDLFEKIRPQIEHAFAAVRELEVGAIANPTEKRKRAVGFYGSLVNINAYDQPGVEAGKKAASKLLELQKQVPAQLSDKGKTAEQIARSVDADPEDVSHSLRHLASNDLRINVGTGDEPADNRFSLGPSK
jgi:glucose-6-phosphate isomerase